MKIFILLTVCCLISIPAQEPNIKLEIGAVLDSRLVLKRPKPGNHHKTSSSQFDPFITKAIEGIEYLIAYDKNSHKITYLYTYDRKFKTKDGLQVGQVLDLTREQVTVNQGWNIYAPKTEDGWWPLIGLKIPGATVEIEGRQLELRWDATEGFLKGDMIHVKIWGFVKNGR